MNAFTVLLAQTTGPEGDPNLLVQFIVGWGPLLLIAWLLYFFVFRALRGQRKIYERSLQHMDTIEAKTDEMIGLLRRIDDKLSRDDLLP